MHALIVTPWYPPLVSGAGAYLAEIADGLLEHGHRVTVLLGQGASADVDASGVRVITVQGQLRGSTSLKLLFRGLAVHRSDPIDLVVAGGGYPSGVIGALLARSIRRPLDVVAFGEDISIAHTSRLARRCLSGVLGTASRCIAASHFTADEVLQFGGSPDRCSVVLPCFDTQRFATVADVDREEFRRRHRLEHKRVVLTVARLEPRKGHDVALQAVAALVPEFDDLHYLIVGRGNQRALRALADQLGVSDRLTILDDVDDVELPAAYASADLFVMVSRPDDRGQVEGFGIVYLEAAATSLPCVAGNRGGCADAVVDGETGFCVDPTDVTAVTAAMRSILASPERGKALAARGRERALSSFCCASFKAQTTALLAETRGRRVGRLRLHDEPRHTGVGTE